MANNTKINSPRDTSGGAASITKQVEEKMSETGNEIDRMNENNLRESMITIGKHAGEKQSPPVSPRTPSRKTSEADNPKRPLKLTLGEFLTGSAAKKSSEDKRAEAFAKLNDKKELAKRLKNSAPCRHMTKKGVCKIKFCSFAHSMEELKAPQCFFEGDCQKLGCNSIHPGETREEWLGKLGYLNIFNLRVLSRPKEAPTTRWDNLAVPKKPTPIHSRKSSLSDTSFSPRDKVIIVFPERFSDRKIKRVFEALVDIDIGNIEVRRTFERL